MSESPEDRLARLAADTAAANVDQWTVRVTAPAIGIDHDAQARLAEELHAGIMVDSNTGELSARFTVIARTLPEAASEALKAAGAFPAKPTSVQVQSVEDWTAEQSASTTAAKRRRRTDAEYAEMAADFEADQPRAGEVRSIEFGPAFFKDAEESSDRDVPPSD